MRLQKLALAVIGVATAFGAVVYVLASHRGASTDVADAAIAPRVDRSFCESSQDLRSYLDADTLSELREKFARPTTVGAFSSLEAGDGAIVAEALRAGVNGPVFGARIVRTLAIIDALTEVAHCQSDGNTCAIRPIIKHLEKTDPPMSPESWRTLLGQWIGYRKFEVGLAKVCMTN